MIHIDKQRVSKRTKNKIPFVSILRIILIKLLQVIMLSWVDTLLILCTHLKS